MEDSAFRCMPKTMFSEERNCGREAGIDVDMNECSKETCPLTAFDGRLLPHLYLIPLPCLRTTMSPALVHAVASVFVIASTALLIASRFLLGLYPYDSILFVVYAPIILVHIYYLAHYAAAWPHTPHFPDKRTRSRYFVAVVYALVVDLAAFPSGGKGDDTPLTILLVQLALLIVQIVSGTIALACAVIVLKPDDLLACKWAHDVRCARCGHVAGEAPVELRPPALPLWLLLAPAASYIPLATPALVLRIKSPDDAKMDAYVRAFVPLVLAYGITYHVFLCTRAFYLQRRGSNTPSWPATPLFVSESGRMFNRVIIAQLWVAHIFLIPGLSETELGRQVMLRWLAPIVVLSTWSACAWTLARAENKAQCQAEPHRWTCDRLFCPVYGIGRKPGPRPPGPVPEDLEVPVSFHVEPMRHSTRS
jgi:hypothetical protein